MLRILSERRAWVVAALVALALVIGVWVWGLPHATARASVLIGERLGVDAQIERSELSFGGVELHGVELRGRHGGLLLRIERVDAKMNPFSVLFQGAGAVHGVAAEGLDLTVDLDHDGLENSLAEIKQRALHVGPSAGSSSARHGGRIYTIEDLRVRVVDAFGSLISLADVSLHKEGDEMRSSAGETILGEEDGDHASVGATKAIMRRGEGAWKIRELVIEEASVRSLRNGVASEGALALRLREALGALFPSGSPVPIDSEEPPDSRQSAASTRKPDRLFARLTPDTRIAVTDVEIESRTTQGHVERIRDFELTLLGGNNGWYRITAGGQTSNGGTLKIDLSVMPEEARADGSIRLQRISLALIAPFAPEIPFYNAELGTLSAELELAASSPEQVSMEGSFQLRELALASERIAPEPVEQINMDLGGKGVWHPDERRLEIEQGQVRIGKARVLIEGELERTAEHYRVDLTAKLPPTLCNDVVAAIPDDVLGSLAQFEWSGNWSALMHLSLDSRALDETELSIRVRNLCQFERAPNWVRVERFQEPFRHRAVEPDETVFEMRTGPGTAYWVDFADISPFMVPAVISHEDGAFYDHAGFAPWAIRDALVRNLQEGRYVVGASTISMQLAKNLYLQREKTIARKVQEVILTWWLENALNKDEILELYLNVIEYGPGVYGLRHAAAYYFGREPIELSPAESAFLACMLPSPKRYHISYERGALTRSMKGSMRRLLEHMAKRERIGPEALAYGLTELDDFRFRRDGDPIAPPRILPPLGAPEVTDPEALDAFETLFDAP